MTDTEQLYQLIRDRGLKIRYVAEQIGVVRSTFYLKACNIRGSEFSPTEIDKLCRVLGIKTLTQKNAVFFAHDVSKTDTREAVKNSL